MNYDNMRELLPHGTAMFPLRVHEFATNPQLLERLDCHWHEEIEFLVVTRGQAEFHINNRNYQVKEGDIVLVHPNLLHSATAVDNLPFQFFAIVFHTSLLDSYFNDSIQQNYLSPIYRNEIKLQEYISPTEDWSIRVSDLLSQIRTLYNEQTECFELRIKSCLYELWYLLFSHCATGTTSVNRDNDYHIHRLKSVMTYLEENYASKITITELASIMGLCERQFCRFFKSMTRMSAIDYLNHYRITQSIHLLSNTDKSISEIAGMCGYNNISYYNKTFLKYMHMTPTTYRKSQKYK